MKKREEIKHKLYSLILRYLLLVVIAFPGLWFFYFIFTPLTIYPSYFILKLFYGLSLSGNTLFFIGSTASIDIINACVAGSAYYLLLILNLSIPDIKFKKRIKIIILSFSLFLIANILRIVILSATYLSKSNWFDITHKLSWYFGSIILVVLIWFFIIKKFNIKGIPFYSDLKFILKYIK